MAFTETSEARHSARTLGAMSQGRGWGGVSRVESSGAKGGKVRAGLSGLLYAINLQGRIPG